jgi:hypothetical protein
LKLFVAQQQMIHTLGNLINGVGMGHGRQRKVVSHCSGWGRL